MEELYKRQFENYSTFFHKDFNNIPEKVVFHDGVSYSNQVGSEKHPHFSFSHSSETKEDFEKNYGNPLCGVNVSRMTFVVEKTEDKVSMKLYFFDKARSAGRVYFNKHTVLYFVTYSFKTNDLYSGRITNSFKKRRNIKVLRKNYFASKPINNIHTFLHNNFRRYNKNKTIETSLDIWLPAIEAFTSKIPNYKFDFMLNTDENLYLHYLKTRGIKYPDNFATFISMVPLASKRVLKKCGNKLVESYMLNNNLSGDKIRRVLQKTEFINSRFYKEVEKFFGEKFLRHQSDEVLKLIFEFKHGYILPSDENLMSETEKKNAFEVFKLVLGHTGQLQTFIDHINFYVMLSKFEEVKWKSNNLSSFNKEHNEWSDSYSHYTTGTYTRFYTEEFVKGVEKSILNSNGVEYLPVVLTKSFEYNMESKMQSNCVKNYINRPASLIISLREGSSYSTERATIEYFIKMGNKNKLRLERVQTLGRFNQELPEKWNEVVKILDKNVEKMQEHFELPKIKVEVGNTVIESDSCFTQSRHSEKMYLNWVSDFIDKIQSNYTIRNLEL